MENTNSSENSNSSMFDHAATGYASQFSRMRIPFFFFDLLSSTNRLALTQLIDTRLLVLIDTRLLVLFYMYACVLMCVCVCTSFFPVLANTLSNIKTKNTSKKRLVRAPAVATAVFVVL
jgi:hypothetical protein